MFATPQFSLRRKIAIRGPGGLRDREKDLRDLEKNRMIYGGGGVFWRELTQMGDL